MVMRKVVKHRVVYCILIVVVGVFYSSKEVFSEEAQQNPMGFSVETKIPDNQVDVTKSYFYLKMDPDQKQVIQVTIKSLQKEPVTVQLGIHDAMSSSSGEIDYTKTNPKLDESLKNPITSLVKVKGNLKEVTVENYEKKIVEYEIETPKKSFPGIKLGSLRYVRKSKQEKESGVGSEYASVVALMLTEDGKQFDKGANLDLKNVNLKLSNGKKVIAANIQNDKPKVLQGLAIKGNVRKSGQKKELTSQEVKNFTVAPNSNFDFIMPLSVEKFRPGSYVFEGEAIGDGRKWKWEKKFTVGSKTASKTNNETVYKIGCPKWAPYLTVFLIVGLVGAVVFLIRRQKQWAMKGK